MRAVDFPESNTVHTREDCYDLHTCITENKEYGCAVSTLIQIEVYVSGTNALMKATKIMTIADDEMRSMFFKRTFGPQQMENLADSNITRLVARYKRTLASGDEL